MGKITGRNFDTAYFDHPVMIIVHPDHGGDDLCNPKMVESCSDIILKSGIEQSPIDCRDIIANGMTFKLTRESLSGVGGCSPIENLFTPPIASNSAATGFTLGEHLVAGRHMTPINLALLKIGQIIGNNLSATGIIWVPARIHSGFEYFSEATYHYDNEGIFPLLSQVAVLEPSDGQIQTRGLDYFCGYELRIIFPSQGSRCDWIRHLLTIAQTAMHREIPADANPLLHKAPEKSQLTGARYVGSCFEINYSDSHSNLSEPSTQL